jgi:drug/metabolite transporter (DMT)-like permease
VTIARIAQIILVMLLWAACFPLIAAGIQFAPHLSFAALRAILAGVALTALALALRRPLPNCVRSWAMVATVGLGATSLGFLGMFHAAEFVSPGTATVIANTQPLLAAVLAAMVLNERLTAHGKVGLVLGFVGILVITWSQLFSNGQENHVLGIVYIMLAVLGITVSNVLIKRIAGRVDALMAMGLQMLIGCIPLVFGAWAMEEPSAIEWSFTFVGILLVLSLFGTALVYWLWFSVLEKAPLTQANAFSFLIPIFGLTMGALFYGETLGLPELVGIALTIVGVSLVMRQGASAAIAGSRG